MNNLNLIRVVSATFVFLVAFYHITGIGNYLQAQRGGIFLWHLWALSIAGCGFLAVVSGFVFRLSRSSVPYLLWCAGLLLICVLSLLIVNRTQTAIDTMTSLVWFFSVSVTLVILVRTPSMVRACGYGAVCAVIVMSVVTIMEFLDPNFQVIVDRFFVDVNEVGKVNRAGAFHINPNNNSAAIALAMFCGVPFLPRLLRLPFILLAGFAIFGTVSRGGITIWALAALYFFFMGYVFRGSIAGKFIGTIIIGGLGFLLVTGQIPILADNLGMEKLLSSDMRERLNSSFFTQEDGSTVSRLEAAQATLSVFVENPVLGIGLGTTDFIDDVGSHNQHLKMAAEVGIFGYLCFTALLFIAVNSRSIFAIYFVVLYFVFGLTNHGLLYFVEYAVLIPLGVIFIPELTKSTGVKKRRRKRRQKKSSFAESQLSA